ncbi:MAG: hypothetical protein M3N14_07955 [Bacteroidota bacterium]|nr:hypothetical protein [Bacteroidota bacterium]
MFNYLVFGLIPLMLLLTAPTLQVVLSICVLKGKIKFGLIWINLFTLVAGAILPVCATMLSIAGLPPGVKCITGNVAIAILGWMTTTVFTPTIGAVFYIIFLYRKKHKGQLKLN